MITASTSKLLDFLISKKNSIEFVSFDVFDTLVRRRIAPPEQVKVASAKTVSTILQQHGFKESAENCLTVRSHIEAVLKQHAGPGEATPKFHLQEIIRCWLNHYLPPEVAKYRFETVYQAEMEAELEVCYSPPNILWLVNEIRSLGKKLIFVSDMYLGITDIEKILGRCGFEAAFCEGFVSSDSGLSKENRNLFEHVLARKQIDPARLIHIGDNVSADYVKPRMLGIRSVLLLDNKYSQWQHRHYKLLHLSRKNPFWEGARWCQMTPHDSNVRLKSAHDLPYAIGYWILGPIFTTFMHEVIDRIAQDGCQTVIFPAREGFLLKQIYEILVEAKRDFHAPPAHYIFLSRRSTFLPSAPEVGIRELTRGHENSTSLRIICTKLNLDIDRLKSIIDESSYYQLDDLIANPRQDARLHEFVVHPDFVAYFEAERNKQSQMLSDYLDQFGLAQVSKAAFVDVGWVGTIQESLALTFRPEKEIPALHGYYMALLDRASVSVQQTAQSKLNGIFFDYRTDREPAIIDRFTELFENAARAPHESTIGYRRTFDGTVVPVLKPSEKDTKPRAAEDAALVASLQSGILEYAEAYKHWLPFQLHGPDTNRAFHLAQWERMTRFPTRHEANWLSKILHTNEFVGRTANGRRRSLSHQGWLRSMFSLLKNEMVWPEGFYASLKIPGANLLFNLYRLVSKQSF